MKRPLVLVSCRVDTRPDIGESRDAVDQRLTFFLHEAGLLTILIPNQPQMALEIFDRLEPSGLVLSGGNDLVILGGDRPERDKTEGFLADRAQSAGIPVLGICRGMQFLCAHNGGQLQSIVGHVRTRHVVGGPSFSDREVNSYHNFGIKTCPADWAVVARAQDESIECFMSPDRLLLGVMWHPERENKFHADDLRMIHDHFRQHQN